MPLIRQPDPIIRCLITEPIGMIRHPAKCEPNSCSKSVFLTCLWTCYLATTIPASHHFERLGILEQVASMLVGCSSYCGNSIYIACPGFHVQPKPALCHWHLIGVTVTVFCPGSHWRKFGRRPHGKSPDNNSLAPSQFSVTFGAHCSPSKYPHYKLVNTSNWA